MSDERYKLRSANVIVLSFAFVSREIFWRNCFAPPCLLRTGGGGGKCPSSASLQLRHCEEDFTEVVT